MARSAREDLEIWTTRDGREIPVEEMPGLHIHNAIAVLSIWRSRLRRRKREPEMVAELTVWIRRFRGELRRRLRGAGTASNRRTKRSAPPASAPPGRASRA